MKKMLLAAVAIVLSFSAMADGLLNANTAAVEELAALPHMDTVLAEMVIDNRPFHSISDLHDLLGADLDEDQIEELYTTVFIPLNLNTAFESQILLIPGVGKRMAHEFEEYRPYSDMQQFRREIGKYVDEDEVARLEQYVTLD